MAIYAISDIHGAYDEFQRLLERIRFRYDGSDSLYLLGDFGDWGEKSMETIQTVCRMDERYDFVHCLMGNHEMMFLSAIEGGIDGDEANDSAVSWLMDNHGLITWNAYTALSRHEKKRLHQWLRALPLSCEVYVGERLFMLAHAYPYYYDVEYEDEERRRRGTDAVWRRLMLHEDPFASYTGEKSYDTLICGHTITDYYFQEQKYQSCQSLLETVVTSIAEVVPGGKNRIFHGEHFIDIDCGAKCMSLTWPEEDSLFRSARRMLMERSALAAYCLDSGEEFYVSRPQSAVSEILEGTVAPSLEVPGRQEMGAAQFSFIPPLPVREVKYPAVPFAQRPEGGTERTG